MEEQSLASPTSSFLIHQALTYWALLDGRPFNPGLLPMCGWQPSGPWLSVLTWIIPWQWTTGLWWRHTDVMSHVLHLISFCSCRQTTIEQWWEDTPSYRILLLSWLCGLGSGEPTSEPKEGQGHLCLRGVELISMSGSVWLCSSLNPMKT